MLTPEQIAAIRDAVGQIADPINEFLLDDIARRIAGAGQLTSTAAYEVWRAQQLGISQREIKKRLRKLLKVSHRDLRRLLTQSAEVGYDFDIRRLPYVQAVPFEQNEALQQIVAAAVELAQADFTNLTQTLGMVDPYGKALPLQDSYRSCMDYAFKQVFTGAADYNTAIRGACKNLAERGVLTIDYQSGIRTSLEAAVRRNIMGGLGLMQEQITQKNHDDLGCDGWEISAHANSAPDHEPIQGRQYSDAAYTALNDSLVRRIGTLNCGHAAFPIILGVNSPQYTPEELEKFREDNEKGITYQGKHYTGYEATQMQRKLETAMRKQKRRILVDEAAGDKEKLLTDQIKLRRLSQEYKRFSKTVGLRTQPERAQVSGFGRGRVSPKNPISVATKAPDAAVPAPPATPTIIEPYSDVTGSWYPDAKPNSHTVQDLHAYTVAGTTYNVDGHNVVLDYSTHEKEIAELLEREVGGEIFMVPRVNNPQGVSTPDYLFHGKGYDLKTIGENAGANTIFNRVKKAAGQANGFILDVTKSGLDDDTINKQIDKLFKRKDTNWVDEIVIVRDVAIVRVVKRT